jgi:chromatin remodeling complex protein RSC6
MPVKKSTSVSAASPSAASSAPVATPAKPAAAATTAAPAKVAAPKAAAPATTPVEPSPVTEVPGEAVSTLDVLESKVNGLLTLAKEAIAALKIAKKEVDKMKKVAEKAERKRANARTSPSGFAKPAKISDDLCGFLNVAKGTEMSRTDVTRHINQYVKANKLFKLENKRVILPNAALKKLLGCKDTDIVTYFNLQRWLKGHFLRPVVVAV